MNKEDIEHIYNLVCNIKKITIPERIWNIYGYGSRIYGTNRNDSDYDLIIVASCMNQHTEIFDGKFNVHVLTKDCFYDKLFQYKMVQLECIFAPQDAIIKNDMKFNFVISDNKLKNSVLSQSHNSWINGKIKLKDCDILRGQKSIFHSLRMLDFAKQILTKRNIYDFTSMNWLWTEIEEKGESEWDYYKKKYLPLKMEMEQNIKKNLVS